MNIRGVRVRILEVTSSFVSFKYESSNAKSRVKRQQFVDDFQMGKLDVVNPSILEQQ
ncbi:MAG: hypothetical protein ACI9P5_003785 [Saprospiraceae bacterium]|jgi:hypothetical protein